MAIFDSAISGYELTVLSAINGDTMIKIIWPLKSKVAVKLWSADSIGFAYSAERLQTLSSGQVYI